eukprot:2150058-Amphidinium_carterae.1
MNVLQHLNVVSCKTFCPHCISGTTSEEFQAGVVRMQLRSTTHFVLRARFDLSHCELHHKAHVCIESARLQFAEIMNAPEETKAALQDIAKGLDIEDSAALISMGHPGT